MLIAAAFNFVTFTMGNPYLLKGLAAIILGVASGAIGGALGTRRTVDLDRTDAELRRS